MVTRGGVRSGFLRGDIDLLRFLLVVLVGLLASGAAEKRSRDQHAVQELLQKGSSAYARGRVEAAMDCWQRVVRKAPPAPPQALMDAHAHLGRAYHSLGHYRQAVVHIEKALSIAEGTEDTSRSVTLKNALGAVLTLMRRWERAESVLIESFLTADEHGLDRAAAAGLNNLGNLYAARGDYSRADEAYQQGLKAARRTGTTAEMARLLANAAISAAAAGRYAEAGELDQQAADAARQMPDGREKAYLLLTLGQTDEKVLSHMPRERNRLLSRASGCFRGALAWARDSGDRRTESYALGHLGQLYELEAQSDEALRLTRRAAFLAQQIQAPEILYRWQWQTGRLLQSEGDHRGAVHALRRAVTTFESIRHEVASGWGNRSLLTSFREEAGGVYYALADALLRLADRTADPAEAEEYVIGARESIELFKTVELEDYFRDRCIDLARRDTERIEQVAPDTATVYLVPLAERTEIIVSFGSRLTRVKAPVSSERLISEIREFRRRLENRTSHRYLRNARQLHKWLIEPVEEALKAEDVSTLVFVPDGALRTVPMAAVHDGDSFLIESYAVAVAPGLTLVDPEPFAATRADVLTCGISTSIAGFSRLDYVPIELNQIAELFGGPTLINDAFRIERLHEELARRPPDMLHIASHGQFTSDPSSTFILAHDGRLTLDQLEMLIRPIEFRGNPVELLALSACETAAGDDRAALGLAGVALKAGARSALATLWFVNDEASARLVSAFYEHLNADSDLSKAEALQKAQCEIMQDIRYRHPCYWAPYLIIGNWL